MNDARMEAAEQLAKMLVDAAVDGWDTALAGGAETREGRAHDSPLQPGEEHRRWASAIIAKLGLVPPAEETDGMSERELGLMYIAAPLLGEVAGAEMRRCIDEIRRLVAKNARLGVLLDAANGTIEELRADRDFLKHREAVLIEALAPVCDNGRYRADIVSRIRQVIAEQAIARDEESAAEKCLHCPNKVNTHELKRRMCERLGKPYEPPKLCTVCLVAAIMEDSP